MANSGIVKKLFLVRHGEAEPNLSNVNVLTNNENHNCKKPPKI